MSTSQNEVQQSLARIERLLEGIADRQKADGDVLRMVAERQGEVIKLLTPQEKDGPSLDELLGHIIGQMTELTGYARQIAKAQDQMERNLPGDVARAIASGAGAKSPGGDGLGANGHGGGHGP